MYRELKLKVYLFKVQLVLAKNNGLADSKVPQSKCVKGHSDT